MRGLRHELGNSGGERTGARRRTTLASSDFGGNGLGMRNGHAKLTRTVAKEKSAPAKKGRAREGDVHGGVAVSASHALSSSASQKSSKKRGARGVRVERRLTAPGTDPLDA